MSVASDILHFSLFSPEKFLTGAPRFPCTPVSWIHRCHPGVSFTIIVGIAFCNPQVYGSSGMCILYVSSSSSFFLANSLILVENYFQKLLEKDFVGHSANSFLSHALSKIHYVVKCFCLLLATVSIGLTQI